MVEQKYIYSFRQKLRKLYEGNVASVNGDIIDMIYDAVNEKLKDGTYTLSTTASNISINIDEEVTASEIIEVREAMKSTIQQFILNNIDSLDIPKDKYNDFMNFVSDTSLICDSYIIGKSVQITL